MSGHFLYTPCSPKSRVRIALDKATVYQPPPSSRNNQAASHNNPSQRPKDMDYIVMYSREQEKKTRLIQLS